tara:strand:+ start:1593 stop:1919 length:327 start_codon:yes stop_codon:yes gene_type:complete
MTPEELFRARGGILMVSNRPPGIGAPDSKENPIIWRPAPQYKTAPGLNLGNPELLAPEVEEPVEEEPVKKLGKSESELSRRERLRKRRDASFKYASIQKQGGKALLGT